ncbi:hydroxymethylbilane synthase [bacterium]|nr:hydroxymethylbilane synthase [bacterium]
MEISKKPLRVGTRRSALARTQTQWVIDRIKAVRPEVDIEVMEVVTTGDRVQDTSLTLLAGKGVFVKEIEEKLMNKEIDLAVHSMKDLPTEFPEGLTVGAIPERVDPRDALVTRLAANLEDLPEGATIGSGSFRRRAQLLNFRPDLKVVDIRGNIDTRLRKSETEEFDGVILAVAGLKRMGWETRIQQYLSCGTMIPAVGQGALGIEIRQDDDATASLIAPLNDNQTEIAITAERTFLHQMGGGCQTPTAAFCRVRDQDAVLQGFCTNDDGTTFHRAKLEGTIDQAVDLASRLADELLEMSRV